MSGDAGQIPKVGFCLLSWADDCSRLPLAFFRTLRAIGYDGVEIPVVDGEKDDFHRLARLLDAADLRRTALTVMPQGANPVGESAAERQEGKRHIAWAIDLARDIGAELLVGPIYQTLGVFTGSPPSPLEFERLADFHRHAGDLAGRAGLSIAIEPMNRFECHVFNRFDALSEYLGRLDHPAVTGLYDTFHANVEEPDPVGALRRNMRFVGHFHVSESDRGIPGRGHAPWADVFSALRSGRYEGWLTAEVFGRAVPAFATVARVWRELPGSLEDICLQSFEHIRSHWAGTAAE